ncbi:MAG: hypothetical protein E7J54_30720 [Pseudomonas aeruginosa]|jgi:hypothetical protein|uniref:hypothetical protein n=1 Tax=Cutibacterium avidum TaxID=33010 RepID=UPI00205F7FA8|nr:hypothetical protein [Pseudomonas aeruginosa]DAI62812.1 MAG TPA: hypothetical protein [Caudoviricetes sp.]
MGGLASTIVTGIATVLAALLTALPALTHRSRKIQRHQAAQIDALEEWAYEARRATRRYNATLPGTVAPMSLPDLPDWMTNAADE